MAEYITELKAMSREERIRAIQAMPTALLFAELEDTIQFDMLQVGNEEWRNNIDKRVYSAIISELQNRLSNAEKLK